MRKLLITIPILFLMGCSFGNINLEEKRTLRIEHNENLKTHVYILEGDINGLEDFPFFINLIKITKR